MSLLAVFLLALLAAAAIALWPMWVRRRRERIAGRPFPPAWRRLLRRHVPLVAFFLLIFIWLGATIYRIQTCIQIGVELCK